MKQKPFIKIKTPAYYIGLGLMKADSSIRPLFIYGRSAKNEEVLEKFDVYAQFEHYFNLAKKGMITDDIESALVSKCLRTPLLVYTREAVKQKSGLDETLSLLVELAGYYGAMAAVFHEYGNDEQTTHYLIKAGEVHGMMYRLHPEARTAKQVLMEEKSRITNEVEELWGRRLKKIKSSTARASSKKRGLNSPAASRDRVMILREFKFWKNNPDEYKNQKDFIAYALKDCEFYKTLTDKTLRKWRTDENKNEEKEVQ